MRTEKAVGTHPHKSQNLRTSHLSENFSSFDNMLHILIFHEQQVSGPELQLQM